MEQKTLQQLAVEGATRFIQVPGPNPILVPGKPDAWDGGILETACVFKDADTYYLYYHARPGNESAWSRASYRLGVATARHPLGPWTGYEGNPVLDLGPTGSWDDEQVACGAVLKEAENTFCMWYWGRGPSGDHVGLATASTPIGPWTKHPGNPVLRDFGYVGGVVKVDGTYRMYNEYPIGGTSPDEGPMALACADKPEGPWVRYPGNPVIPAGDWGAWDDGGYSESGMLYHDGVYHMFYGGTKWMKFESIGYAYSLDGINFIKHRGNPVAPRETNADASAFAEACALWEAPFYYVYHTLRYISEEGSSVEDLGVQILATETPFRFAMPVLSAAELGPGESTELADCRPMALSRIADVALTVTYTSSAEAKEGVTLHLKSSPDGINYDTQDMCSFDIAPSPGRQTTKTVTLTPRIMFAKAVLTNRDSGGPVTDLHLTAALTGA